MEAIIVFALFAILFWTWGYGMRKIMIILVKFGIYIGRLWHLWWSNTYWKDKARRNVWLDDADKRYQNESASEYIQRMSRKAFAKFDYKSDSWAELRDSVPPPTEMYARYRDAMCEVVDSWSDDCDGYHSLMYHFAAMNGIECKMLSITSAVCSFGHAVLAYKDGEKWHICDYLADCTDSDLEVAIRSRYEKDTCGEYVVFERTFDYVSGKWQHVKKGKSK